ncbi:ABC transporter ATP-binding protein [Anoxybacillus ayderensis]|uniref:ABC transporter ATP-binding protein n=1 Tax=Anoxybacillus sp. ST70 TaxID=2864180 RepID=UPI0003171C62|nr:ABC transporter ATP-binding protein [Anoxybacillus sp. ST70]AXM87755.1 ABC transporter ATP-binding protein [Anoxybacillus ayderensis G10]MBW9218486.1 ABC transporter ATP-binding protein [Anoxybacillus sp. ST70]THD16236.1 ABC transporter ATP-binding protein [Anoxybacillus ayderensis]
MIEFVHISKTYDGKTFVIKDISVQVKEGEFFVLVGPSGCGKSTLLRMIAGLESITSGQLKIAGREMNNVEPSERHLSMVFQNYALYPHLTVQDNILLGLYKSKISKVEKRKRCSEVAELLDLTHCLNKKPRHLSGGQRQRVALARAIVSQKPICLMDEPLSNLDAKLRTHMRSYIRQLQRQLGMTIIYVTHDQVEAMTMADRMMILHEGKIQQIGDPLYVYNNPNNTFVASFIGSPPINMARVHKLNDLFLLQQEWIVKVAHHVQADNKYGTIAVRPEHIRLAHENEPHVWLAVTHVERLGTETLVTLKLTEQDEWIARWQGQHSIEIGQQVRISINDEHVLFFDEEGKRIAKEGEEHAVYDKTNN